MTKAYYNEIDPYAAEWLNWLILEGVIAHGDVDTRSIEDVRPSDLAGYTQCHFFAGVGVWSYALRLAGWPDDRPVWTGSCPCQPFSQAGKGKGTADTRHLWPSFFHLIDKCRPAVVFGEQVAGALGLSWLRSVRTDMEGSGYSFGALGLCAAGIGAPHGRHRIYLAATANSSGERWEGFRIAGEVQPESRLLESGGPTSRAPGEAPSVRGWMQHEPMPSTLAHGVANRVEQMRAYGNAIVAPLAAEFIGAYLDV